MQMREKVTIIVCCLSIFLPIQVPCLAPPSEPEILFAKRIVEIWSDRDAQIVISQSQQFLHRYPNSVFKDAILGIVAESHKYRGEYPRALQALRAIQSTEYKRKTLITKVDILQKMNQDQQIIKELQPHIPEIGVVPTDGDSQLYTLCYADAVRGLANKTSNTDKQKQYYSIASRRYRTLKGTQFDCHALVGLASLYIAQGKEREGAKIYLGLADDYLENRDAYLYQAAKLQMVYDPEEAFATLDETSEFSPQNQSERAVLKAKILYDLEKHDYLIHVEKSLKETVAIDHLPIIDYYLGMSFFKEKDYDNASDTLGNLVKTGFRSINSKDIQKSIILHLITTEYQRSQPQAAMAYIDHYKQRFPNDEGIVHAYLVKGIYLLNNKMANEALKHLEQTMRAYPEANEINHIKHQRNIALMKLEQWETARSLFVAFAKENPKSPLKVESLKNIPVCTQKLIAKAKEEEKPTKSLYRQLIEDLQLMMNTKGVLTAKQKPSVLIEQIRSYNACSDYPKAYKLAKIFLDKYPDHTELYQVHVLIAQAMDQIGCEKTNSIEHLETALTLNGDMPQAALVHVKLFKAYVDLVEEKHDDHLVDLACDHLYSAYTLSETMIPEENRIWLANTFTSKLENRSVGHTYTKLFIDKDLQAAEKALTLYQSVGMTSKDKTNFAKCCIWGGNPTDALGIIEEVEQDTTVSDSDKYVCDYLKGKILESRGDKSRALELFKSIPTSSGTPQFVGLSASLQTARLTIDIEETNSPLQEQAYKKLKQLQMQKQLKTEPVHLEAALDYCFMTSNQAPPEKRNKNLLNLLKTMKADFTNIDDISSQDYHNAMEQNPERKEMYHHYMLLVDSYINMIEAKYSTSYKDKQIKNEVAENLLQTITRNKAGLTDYLERQVELAVDRLHTK